MSQPAPSRDVVYNNGRLILPDGRPVSFVTEKELAVLLFKPENELQKWRTNENGKFPKLRFFKVAKLIRYSADDVCAFIQKNLFADTKQAGSKVSAKSNKKRSASMKQKWADKRAAKEKAHA